MTQEQWDVAWASARLFLTADGEAGKTGRERDHHGQAGRDDPGQGTGRSARQVRGRYTLTGRVDFGSRGGVWSDRVAQRLAVTYQVRHDPARRRWYLTASWSTSTTVTVPCIRTRDGKPSRRPVTTPAFTPSLDTLRRGPVLAVDLNHGHLAGWVIDTTGNPVGPPVTVPLDLAGKPATQRDAVLRHAVTRLIRVATRHGCAAFAVEDLNFADARAVGRETMGRGRKGKRFRRTVAGIPTAQFRDRLVGMAANAGLYVIAVDPAYTSKWGAQHWLDPVLAGTPGDTTVASSGRLLPSPHHAAAVAIGRRSLGAAIRRKPQGPRPGQRTRTQRTALKQRASQQGQRGTVPRHAERSAGSATRPTPTPPTRASRTGRSRTAPPGHPRNRSGGLKPSDTH